MSRGVAKAMAFAKDREAKEGPSSDPSCYPPHNHPLPPLPG